MADINIQIKRRNGTDWDNLFPKTKAELVEQTDDKRFVSSADIASWNGKQDSLGFTPLSSTLRGVANGVAELDANGRVPASQLPSYVDDVLEFTRLSDFPTTGETDKIYIAKDTNIIYRWSGTDYVEISASLALGETSSTAYRGDKGKTAYDHSQSAHAPANAQKNSDITKAEIEAKLTGTITTHTHSGLMPANHAANHITGGPDIIPDAIANDKSGLMSAADKAKLDSIAADANNYTHPTTAGNKHIPAGGAAGQALIYSGSSGTAKWETLTPQSVGAQNITLQATAPASPATGDLWFEILK